MQNAAFYTMKGYLLHDERMPFTRRKDAFYDAEGGLLGNRRYWTEKGAAAHTLVGERPRPLV